MNFFPYYDFCLVGYLKQNYGDFSCSLEYRM